MINADDMSLKVDCTIKQALKVINKGASKIAIIVDEKKRLIGTLTDGDIRRALLNGADLDSQIEPIFYKNPTFARVGDSQEQILKLALSKHLYQIPIIDENGTLLGLKKIEELVKPKNKINQVILMVGGLGNRLRPLTESIPKPMLKVGSKPILQIIIERFVKQGYTNITLCTGYKSEVIEDFFQNGEKFGAKIDYVKEDKRLGTAGALGILKYIPKEPFFVMNGDILSEVNFDSMLEKHMKKNALATMGTREFEYQVPYGVIEEKDDYIIQISEKPLEKYCVSAGIYILDPKCLSFVDKNSYLDMPNLFLKLINENLKTSVYKIDGYWIDIGRHEEYERANIDV
ncbi:nucleotidyltransferase family protein [Campylobacter sputorum]|uniref:nucleotidyltransferase family protein n=1 Tax=Campylobacter sputorum TaxID=206 RepID=UPI00053BDF89|nr:nucleotidyltransferase family protein [Campylobacter sputorum]